MDEIIQSFSGWLSRMTTNYRKYVERITVMQQEFVAYTGTTNLKSSVLLCAYREHARGVVLRMRTVMVNNEWKSTW